MHGSIKEELNLDKVIDNIQHEPIMSIESIQIKNS
jgi:hypothetical protein